MSDNADQNVDDVLPEDNAVASAAGAKLIAYGEANRMRLGLTEEDVRSFVET